MRVSVMGDSVATTREGRDPFRRVTHLIQAADVRLLNLEAPLTRARPTARKHVRLRTDPGAARHLAEAGINLAQVDNNHAQDCGEAGYVDTLDALYAAGVLPLGRRLPIVTRRVKGMTLAIVGAWVFLDAPERTLYVFEQVRKWHRHRDAVLVSLHWGEEHMPAPSPAQVTFARGLIDAGATVVVGHHSHCLQGVERYRDGLIAYSLGNFNFFQLDAWHQRLGGILSLVLEPGRVKYWTLTPTWIGEDWAPRVQPFTRRVKEHLAWLDGLVGTLDEGEWYELFGWGYVTQTLRSTAAACRRHGPAPLVRLARWARRAHTRKALRAALRTGRVDRWMH